ncbi:hypothetical protein RESH_04952 [Rhodopirellula europaea SH398]|uniref:Uncharacterized protein n=1 Tax=Rhodopirellula europaea SH398 TaxID=1263868 RepID=M5RZD8_9BACT|nr:hypothetical protein RESH_04952 [Rhodopirellula europaea SH398]
MNVGQMVNVVTRFSLDASPQLHVFGEHMSDSPNRRSPSPNDRTPVQRGLNCGVRKMTD